jgi:hypothetical protein
VLNRVTKPVTDALIRFQLGSKVGTKSLDDKEDIYFNDIGLFRTDMISAA